MPTTTKRTPKFARAATCGALLVLAASGGVFAGKLDQPTRTVSATLSPVFAEALLDSSADRDTVCMVLVIFATNSSFQPSASSSQTGITLAKRRALVTERLRQYTDFTEDATLGLIQNIPQVSLGRRFWVVRAHEISAPLSALAAIAGLPGVSAVIPSVALELLTPQMTNPVEERVAVGPSQSLVDMNIPALWQMGLNGSGRLVANFDTGVEGSHPALASQYLGLISPATDCFFSTNPADSVPIDRIGHGTHTMGLMVGHTAFDTFGVAPGASWIAAAVIDQGKSLNGTIADILAAFQWALNPDGDFATTNDIPDVILNSWGIPNGIFPDACDNTFWQAIDNVEEAGIVTVFAAGNEGPAPQSVRSPANRITSSTNCFAVGAIENIGDTLATFSSRGPSACDGATVKPEVVAPGVSIYSSSRGGSFAIRSGTSMAAPFVAGMVALLRQYNPNASPSDIKKAIIASCRDMGAPGPDNNYGSGLPDALVALQYMPRPSDPTFTMRKVTINGDGIAAPGETVGLEIEVTASVGTIDSISGVLRSLSAGVTILPDTILYFFSSATGAGTNARPFQVAINADSEHGSSLSLVLELLYSGNNGHPALDAPLTIGLPPKGALMTHNTSGMEFTVSDFGQFGFGANSGYSAGGRGLRRNGGPNLLYDAGLVVGRNSLQISSATRDSLGRSFIGDFAIISPLAWTGAGANEYTCSFDDHTSPIPLPITLTQRSVSFDDPASAGFVILEFGLTNTSLEPISGVRLGYFADFDLDQMSKADKVAYDASRGLLVQSSTDDAVGIVALTPTSGPATGANGAVKSQFGNSQKYALLSAAQIPTDGEVERDYYSQLNFGPFTLQPWDTVRVAIAILAGANTAEIIANADQARQRYLSPTATDDGDGALTPASFTLDQNYPNPFNPHTTISFSLPAAQQARLTIYNILGAEVVTLLDGPTTAGKHDILWNGQTNADQAAATGVYFYRLESAGASRVRAMTLVK